MNPLRWLLPSSKTMSVKWLKDQDRRESRIEFHGVSVNWPIKKVLNENPLWQTHKLRKSA